MRSHLLIPLAIIAGLCLVPLATRKLMHVHRIRATAVSENYSRLRDLSMLVGRAASHEPSLFSSAVGNGLTNVVTSIPSQVRTNIIYEEDSRESQLVFTDSWGNPVNLSIAPTSASHSEGKPRYVIKVWSNGPNGINELGFGDDVALPEQQVPPD